MKIYLYLAVLTVCSISCEKKKLIANRITITNDKSAATSGRFKDTTNITSTSFTLNWTPLNVEKAKAEVVSEAIYCLCTGAGAAEVEDQNFCVAKIHTLECKKDFFSKNILGKLAGTTYFYNVVVKTNAKVLAIYRPKIQTTLASTGTTPPAIEQDHLPPTPGLFTSATNVTSSSFTLNWTAAVDTETPAAGLQYMVCSGTSAASIDTLEECKASTVAMPYTANILTFAVNSKSAMTTYYYNVVVKDTSGMESVYAGSSPSTSVLGNLAPSLSIVEPSGMNDVIATNSTFNITYTASDTDDNATVTLYGSTSSSNCTDGSLSGWTQIATGLMENSTSSYAWDTTGQAAGNYYICGEIDDGANIPVHAVSSSYVSINAVPSIALVDPANAVSAAQIGNYTITFTPADSDDNAVVTLFYKAANTACNASLAGWTQIVTGLGENSASTYSWATNTVTPGTYYICARIADGVNASAYAVSTGTVQINAVPTLSISEPAGADDIVALNASFNVTLAGADIDDSATISLYYKTTSANCSDGSLTGWTSFATSLAENTTIRSWDTNGIAAGNYYICGKIDDTKNPAVYAVSPSYLKIDAPPTVTMINPATAVVVPQVGTYTLTYSPTDSDDNASVALYYKSTNSNCDSSLTGWTSITNSLPENTVSSYVWTTTAVTAGTYYICAKIADGVNADVYSVSGGTLKINAVPTFTFSTVPLTTQLYRLGTDIVQNFAFTAADSDDVATVTLYRKTGNSGTCTNATFNSFLLSTEAEGVDTPFAWDTSALSTPGPYYICGRINDGVNPVVDVHSSAIYYVGVCTWTGAISQDWATPGNWSGCGATYPTGYRTAIIPSAPSNQPLIAVATSFMGFAPGSGGGVVTIAPGAAINNYFGVYFYIDSNVKIQGGSATCTTCFFSPSDSSGDKPTVRLDAKLILGSGIALSGGSSLFVGNSTTPGHFETIADSGVIAEYPRIAKSGFGNYGIIVEGTATTRSSIKITGMTVESGGGGANAYFVGLYGNVDVVAMDSVKVKSTWTQQLVRAYDCTGSVMTDTSWTGWQLDQKYVEYPGSSFGSVANCSAVGPVTISGSGVFYGPVSEYGTDLGNLYSWTNGSSFTCTWTGTASTDWFDPTNWSGCANSRSGYPDLNDVTVVTNTPTNQPVISGRTAIKALNTGVSVGAGGTITIASGSELILDSNYGDIKIQGATTTCTDCILTAPPRNLYVMGATTTLYLGSGITVDGTSPIYVNNQGGNRIYAESTSNNVAEWPTIKTQLYIASGAKMYLNGVNFSKSTAGTSVNAPGSSHIVQKFDRLIFDQPTTTNNVAISYIAMANCNSSTYTDTTWSELDFVDGITTGKNVAFTNCSTGPAAGTITITPRSGGTNLGYGATYATDPTNIIIWQ